MGSGLTLEGVANADGPGELGRRGQESKLPPDLKGRVENQFEPSDLPITAAGAGGVRICGEERRLTDLNSRGRWTSSASVRATTGVGYSVAVPV